jgi:hypothetical protein
MRSRSIGLVTCPISRIICSTKKVVSFDFVARLVGVFGSNRGVRFCHSLRYLYETIKPLGILLIDRCFGIFHFFSLSLPSLQTKSK